MNAMFKLCVGYECGGPEDGMMCHDYTEYYEGTMSLSEYIKQYGLNLADRIEHEVRKKYKEDRDFIGCRFIGILSEEEIRELQSEELPF